MMINLPVISFKGYDAAEIEDVLGSIARSFHISFLENDLAHLKTFGDLCNVIEDKVHLNDVHNCTSQQAFYKLREAFISVLHKDRAEITVAAELRELLPWKTRRQDIAAIERKIGFPLEVLRPNSWLFTAVLLCLMGSLAGLFVNWAYGLAGIFSTIVLIKMLSLFGKELQVKTVGKLAEKMTAEHNILSRRNPMTFNRMEVEQVVRKLFADNLGMDEEEFVRDAVFA